MNWPTVPLKQIAPSQASDLRFEPDSIVWHLTLDQIESQTGYIINKRNAQAKDAGTSTYAFDDGNVLYSKLRPYLNKVICPDEAGIATTELVPLRPRAEILNRHYLTYYLRSNHFLNFANVAVAGVKMPRIIMDKFWKHQIPLPALSEQRRIIEILDQAAALRKKRAQADDKAARILPSVFYRLFGDPVTNPRDWPTKPLGEVTIGNPQYGANASATKWIDGSPRYVRITDITADGRLLKSGVVTLNLDDWAPYKLTPGDLLFARSGNTVGKTYLYQPQDGLCAYAGYLIRFKADQNQVLPWYLFALTQTGYYKSWVEARKRVAGQPNINGKEYSSLQIPCPPIPLQEAFVEKIERLIDIRKKQNTTEHKIQQLFSVLLHRAFSGELTGKWRESHMKELLAEMEDQARTLEETKSCKPIRGRNKKAVK